MRGLGEITADAKINVFKYLTPSPSPHVERGAKTTLIDL
jgi:hypothetical protein